MFRRFVVKRSAVSELDFDAKQTRFERADRELNVAARDDLAAQDRVTVTGDTGCMVSGCHAGNVDSEAEPHAVATLTCPLNHDRLQSGQLWYCPQQRRQPMPRLILLEC